MKARWNLGTWNKPEGVSAAQMYTYERGTKVFQQLGYSGEDKLTRTTTWDGLVALMYPSDYGFASSDETCLNDLYNCNNDNNRNNNWIYISNGYNGLHYSEWLLTPSLDNNFGEMVFNILGNGNDYDKNARVNGSTAMGGIIIRPTLYLKSNTLISGGDGTISNPYTIE